MIAVTTLHYEIRRSLNRINTSWNENINTIDLDGYINKSIDYVQENYVQLAERNKLFENHLRELEIPDIKLQLTSLSNNKVIGKFPSNYYDYLRINVTGSKVIQNTKCVGNIWNIRYYQMDDISEHDPNFKPSWGWRSGLFNINSLGLSFYHGGEYDVENISMTYIKKIPHVANVDDLENKPYVRSDNTVIPSNIDLEVSSTALWRKICEITEFYIRKDQDGNYKGTIDSIMFNETTGISK